MQWTRNFAVMLALGVPATSYAKDKCPDLFICASNPQAIVESLQVQGYRAQLGKTESSGNPKIESAANGYTFTIYFYDCTKGEDCQSLGFDSTFTKEDRFTHDFANAWNKANRYSQMAINDNGNLSVTYDVSTMGGLNRINFVDVMDWWESTLGRLRTYFDKNPGKYAAPGK